MRAFSFDSLMSMAIDIDQLRQHQHDLIQCFNRALARWDIHWAPIPSIPQERLSFPGVTRVGGEMLLKWMKTHVIEPVLKGDEPEHRLQAFRALLEIVDSVPKRPSELNGPDNKGFHFALLMDYCSTIFDVQLDMARFASTLFDDSLETLQTASVDQKTPKKPSF